MQSSPRSRAASRCWATSRSVVGPKTPSPMECVWKSARSSIRWTKLCWSKHRNRLLLVALDPGHFDGHIEPEILSVNADQRRDERRAFLQVHLDQQVRQLVVKRPAIALVHPDP